MSGHSFEKDSEDLFKLLQSIWNAKQKISVLANERVFENFKKYCKAYVRERSGHRDAVLALYTGIRDKLIQSGVGLAPSTASIDFMKKEAVVLEWAPKSKVKIHLSMFYEMARDVVDHYSKSDFLPNMVGREETKMVRQFEYRLLGLFRHVALNGGEKTALQKRMDEVSGSSGGPGASADSPFGAMIQMMSGMFSQLGQMMPPQQAQGPPSSQASSSGSAVVSSAGPAGSPSTQTSAPRMPDTGAIFSTVQEVMNSAQTQGIVEEIGKDLGGTDNMGTALAKVFGKLTDPAFSQKLMSSFAPVVEKLAPGAEMPPANELFGNVASVVGPLLGALGGGAGLGGVGGPVSMPSGPKFTEIDDAKPASGGDGSASGGDVYM